MFRNILSSIALADAVSASPLTSRQGSVLNYLPLSSALAVQLVTNVTNVTNDLNHTVQGLMLNSIYTEAGLNDAVLQADGNGAVFHLNS